MIAIKQHFKKYLTLTLALLLTVLSANVLPVYASGTTGPNGEFIPSGYQLATDSDFEVYSPGGVYKNSNRYRYIGTKQYVVIPHKIKGVELKDHDYYGMFEYNKNIRGVASNNPKVTGMDFMFYSCESPSLDLSYLDTSNVEDMSNMFTLSKTTTLNISNFNTSKVENMRGMFSHSKIKTINLNHFDCSRLIDADQMFAFAEATSISFKNFNVIPADEFIEKLEERELLANREITTWNPSAAYMYEGTKVTSIDISNLDLDDYAFDGKGAGKLDASKRHASYSLGGIASHSNIKTIFVGSNAIKKHIEATWPPKPAGVNIVVR